MAERVQFRNIEVSLSGEIFDRSGRQVRPRPNGKVTVDLDGTGRKKSLLASRIVYEACSGEKLPRTSLIRYCDGNPGNTSFENLVVVSRRDLLRDTPGLRKKKKFSEKKAASIAREYNRDERKKHNFEGEWAHPSIADLCRKYGCSRSTIQKIVAGEY